jgi:hypothetical protein
MGSYPVNLVRQCARAVAIWLEGGPIPHTVVDAPRVPDDLAAAIGAPYAGGARTI